MVGLGLDLTATEVVTPHPTDPTAPDLPRQPVLFAATSDGVLRAYTFGNTATADGSAPQVVAPPVGPPLPPLALLAVPAAPTATPAAAAAAADARAAATALPDEEEDELEVRPMFHCLLCCNCQHVCHVPPCAAGPYTALRTSCC